MTTDQTNAEISKVTGVERDYANCLNAMHEAEKALTDKQRYLFLFQMAKLLGYDRDVVMFSKTGFTEDFANMHWLMSHATAAQRAEAFLKTLGLWKE
jgi:hypothetical protein